MLNCRSNSSLQHGEPDVLPLCNNDVEVSEVTCQKSNRKVSKNVTAVQHTQSLQPEVIPAVRDAEQDKNLVKRSSRLSRKRQMKPNATVTVSTEVATCPEQQSLQAPTAGETLHDDTGNESQARPARRSLRRQQKEMKKRKTEESTDPKSQVDSQKHDGDQKAKGKVVHKSVSEAPRDADGQSEPKSLHGSLTRRGQLNKQTDRSSSREHRQKPESCGSQQDLPSAHKVATHSAATNTCDTDEMLLDKEQPQRQLRCRGERKKQTEKSANQNAKMIVSQNLDSCHSLSSFQVNEAMVRPSEASCDPGMQLGPKSPQRSLRIHEQVKKQTKKSLNTAHQLKPSDVCSSQQMSSKHEVVTRRSAIKTSDADKQANGAHKSVSEADKQSKPKSRQRSLSAFVQLKKLTERSQNRECEGEPDVSSSQQDMFVDVPPLQQEDREICISDNRGLSAAISSQSEELLSNGAAECCASQSETLPKQSQAATEISANSPCSSAVIHEQEQSTVSNAVFDTDDSIQDACTVRPINVKISKGSVNLDDVHSQTVASRALGPKSSVPRCADISAGVVPTGRTEMSDASGMGFVCASTMMREANSDSPCSAEGRIRIEKVMSEAVQLDLQDEQLDEDVKNRAGTGKTSNQREAASRSKRKVSETMTTVRLTENLQPEVIAAVRDAERDQNLAKWKSRKSGRVLSSIDNLPYSRRLQTGSYGHATSTTLVERTYDSEDPVADDDSAASVAPDLSRRQKCSVTAVDHEFAGAAAVGRRRKGHSALVIFDRGSQEENNEMPSSMVEILSQAQCVGEIVQEDESAVMMDDSECSQQLHRHQKCSVVASEYTDSAESKPPATISWCRQSVDTVRAETKPSPRPADDDPDSTTSTGHGLRDTDDDCSVADEMDPADDARENDVGSAGQQRTKISEPLLPMVAYTDPHDIQNNKSQPTE